MSLAAVRIGKETFSKLIIGGNPFSGFSHQSPAKDDQMRHHYTTARIRETLLAAERLGITAHISRADHHVMRYLMEHWDQGGKMQWIAQTCPEVGSIERAISNASNVLPVPGSPLMSSGRDSTTAALTAAINSSVAM